MSRFQWVRAASWAQASELVKSPGSLAKGGGVDLWDRLKEGLEDPDRVISLLEIPSGRTIELLPDGSATIGALATIAEIAGHDGLRKAFPALVEACDELATPAIRNAATLAGNLCQRPRCWYFRSELHPCLRKGGGGCFAIPGDHRMHAVFDNSVCAAVAAPSTATPLVALRAEAVVRAGADATRIVPIESLFVPSSRDPRREVALSPGELVEQIRIPAAKGRSAYVKLQHRETFDWPIVEVSVALSIAAGKISDVRIVLGSVAMTPIRAARAESLLEGAAPGSSAFASASRAATAGATPLPRNEYKIPIVESLVREALSKAAGV
ncbi:MAG: FAD binding domain-containing protein [Deltaproteobacteria bacterium]|nr:FAD binding domain-containing protein [Deltaproteobacteria bacterium]